MKTIIKIVYIFLILFTILFFVNFYLAFQNNIQVQKYLINIYDSLQKMNKKYHTLLNKDSVTITRNGINIVNDILNPNFFSYIRSNFNSKKYK